MLFLVLSNANVKFAAQKRIWRSYTAAKTLSTTKQVELIDKKKLAGAALNEQLETFVVYVTALKAPSESAKMTIYLIWVAQIFGDNFV